MFSDIKHYYYYYYCPASSLFVFQVLFPRKMLGVHGTTAGNDLFSRVFRCGGTALVQFESKTKKQKCSNVDMDYILLYHVLCLLRFLSDVPLRPACIQLSIPWECG